MLMHGIKRYTLRVRYIFVKMRYIHKWMRYVPAEHCGVTSSQIK